MSKEIDEKVVSMQFDNKNFEKNVSTSMSTIDKLKSKLQFSGAAKGLENVEAAAQGVKLNPLASAVETVGLKFNALQVMATTALANITNSAVNAGKRLVSAFTIDPIKTGLQEYETQINAVQTILANTQSKGTTIDDVNKALDELNHYADMTIYNFTEMTRNIGTFTAAGVDLDTSVSAIKGIANLAAVSGSTSQQASTAMYQLSQALSSGTVKLMDWNSVVNAGMGGQVFQDALKETARVHDIEIDAMIEKNGSFRETLQEGWLSSEILLETLNKFTGDLSEEQLVSMGYTKEQITEIMKLGQTANDAATKVKTFTQLMDTLKEAAQSGWTQTWELLVGDFEEAKKLWTSVSDVFSEIINSSSEARNNLIQGWVDGGGRDDMLASFKNVYSGIVNLIKPIRDAFREIFPKTTADQLLKITSRIKEITENFKLSDKATTNLKDTFKGLFSVVDIGLTVIKNVVKAVASLFGGVGKLSGKFLEVTGAIGRYLTGLRDSINESEKLSTILTNIADVLKKVFGRFVEIIGVIAAKIAAPGFKWFFDLLNGLWNILKKIGSAIGTVAKQIANGLKEAFQNGQLDGISAIVNGGILAAILLKFKKFIDGFKNPFEEMGGMIDGIKDMFSTVGDALQSWQQNLQAKTILTIAGAIAILAASVLILSSIDTERLIASLGAISVLFYQLMAALSTFAKISGPLKGVAKATAGLIGISISLLILAGALKILSTMSWDELGRSLVAMAGALTILVIALKAISKVENFGAGVGKIILLITPLILLAGALKILSTMSWNDIGRSLVAMAGALAILVIVLKAISKVENFGVGVGKIILLITPLILLAASLKILATMSWDDIGRSLVAMAGALAILVGALALLSFVGPAALAGSAAILILSAAMLMLVPSLAALSLLDIGKVATGLLALGGALIMFGLGAGFAGIFAPMIALLAISLSMLIPAFAALSLMNWGTIAKGLLAIGGALAILGIAAAILAPLTPVMLALAASFALMGVGTVLLGAGLVAISAGLTALAAALSASASLIVAGLQIIINGIINLIPSIVIAIGNGLIGILKVIAGSGKAIFDAVSTILVSLLDVIISVTPKLVEAVGVIIVALVNKIVELTPTIVTAAVNIVVAIVSGIAQGMPRIIQAATDLVVNFLKGISDNLPRIIQAGFDLIINFLDGLTNAIETNIPVIAEKIRTLVKTIIDTAIKVFTDSIPDFFEIGGNLIRGFIDGITSVFSNLWSSVTSVFSWAVDGVKSLLGIHSPSTVMAEVGENFDKGFIVGVKSYGNEIASATEDAGILAVDSMSNAISKISDAVDSNINSEPVIKPVLDLSDIENGMNGINGLNTSVGVMSNIGAISSSMNQNGSLDILGAIKDLGKQLVGNTGNVYTINGITYEDGSSVSDAINDLVRAARIERRV